MASKNPTSEIAAKIALDGGFDPCETMNKSDLFWSSHEGCEPDFIGDDQNGYCYKVLSTLENLDDGEKLCNYQSDAELLMFDTNSEVKGLIRLIKNGTFIFQSNY
jgi:hypothetical protein